MAARPNPVPKLASEGVILVDSNFAPVAMDSGAQAIFHDLKKSNGASDWDPENMRQIRALFHGCKRDDCHGMLWTLAGGGREYSFRAFLVKAEDGTSAPIIALHLRQEVSVFDVVRKIAVEYRLTDREQEALMGISKGWTSKEVAAQMNISPNTVKAFLRMIMIKTGTASRAGVVAKLLDHDGSHIDEPPQRLPPARADASRKCLTTRQMSEVYSECGPKVGSRD
jgi:DNA-binding CsgD family transcriptional regulator